MEFLDLAGYKPFDSPFLSRVLTFSHPPDDTDIMATSSTSSSCAPFGSTTTTIEANYTTPGANSAYEGLVTCPAPSGGLDVLIFNAEATEIEVLVPFVSSLFSEATR